MTTCCAFFRPLYRKNREREKGKGEDAAGSPSFFVLVPFSSLRLDPALRKGRGGHKEKKERVRYLGGGCSLSMLIQPRMSPPWKRGKESLARKKEKRGKRQRPWPGMFAKFPTLLFFE